MRPTAGSLSRARLAAALICAWAVGLLFVWSFMLSSGDAQRGAEVHIKTLHVAGAPKLSGALHDLLGLFLMALKSKASTTIEAHLEWEASLPRTDKALARRFQLTTIKADDLIHGKCTLRPTQFRLICVPRSPACGLQRHDHCSKQDTSLHYITKR